MSIIAAAITAAHRAAVITHGGPATYTRGANSCTLSVVPGETRAPTFDGAGVETETQYFDWLILAADLVLANERTRPAAGDTLTINGDVFTVRPLTPNEKPWRRRDAAGLLLRIHTVLTTDATA